MNESLCASPRENERAAGFWRQLNRARGDLFVHPYYLHSIRLADLSEREMDVAREYFMSRVVEIDDERQRRGEAS